MTTETPRLPDKPSELVELVIQDWERIDRFKYVPCHAEWHNPQKYDGECAVCDAGAVMAGTLGISYDREVFASMRWDDTFDVQTREKLEAIDSIRVGFYEKAARRLGFRRCDSDFSDFPASCLMNFTSWSQIDARLPHLREVAEAYRKIGL